MREPVLLKGNNYGLSITLDQSMEFQELLVAVEEKFFAAAGFFNSKKQIALKIEGRTLSSEEISQLLSSISKVSSLSIAYVVEDNEVLETQFKQLSMQHESPPPKRPKTEEEHEDENLGKFYKGTLRSGQKVTSDSSIVVIGDVNPGATVEAKGNVVVLGRIKGYVFAGSGGNSEAFIVALDMDPIQIRIGTKIARSSDEKEVKKKGFRKKKKEQYSDEAKIAFVEDGNIYIEPISKALLNEVLI